MTRYNYMVQVMQMQLDLKSTSHQKEGGNPVHDEVWNRSSRFSQKLKLLDT